MYQTYVQSTNKLLFNSFYLGVLCKNVTVKRKHSSRMHTTHLVTVHVLSLGVSAGVGVGIQGLGDGYTMDLGYPPPGHTHP